MSLPLIFFWAVLTLNISKHTVYATHSNECWYKLLVYVRTFTLDQIKLNNHKYVVSKKLATRISNWQSCFCCMGFHNTKHAMIKAWIKLWLRPLGESLHQIPLSRAIQSRTRGFKITTRAEVLRIADTKLHTQLATRKDGPKDRQQKNNNPTARHNSRRRGIKTNNAKKVHQQ